MSFPNSYVPSGAIGATPSAMNLDIGGIISGLVNNSSGVCCAGFFIPALHRLADPERDQRE